jgi:hypothetical protein
MTLKEKTVIVTWEGGNAEAGRKERKKASAHQTFLTSDKAVFVYTCRRTKSEMD